MMRFVLLIVALVFTAAMAVVTVLDATRYGVNLVDIFAGLIVVLFATGILGALLHRPPGE
jgi:hypothetical protein